MLAVLRKLSCYFMIFVYINTIPRLDYLLYANHSDTQCAMKDVGTR